MDFIDPEGFLVEAVESEGKADKEAEKKDQDLFLLESLHGGCLIQWANQSLSPLERRDPKEKDTSKHR